VSAYQKEKLLDQEAATSGTKKLDDLTTDEVITLLNTLSIDNCAECKES
jgi:hypothetical protein